jgi:hypothetical protein
MKNKLILLNFILCSIGSLILGVGAKLLFLGDYEDWLMIKHNLPLSFFQRLFPFLLIGLIGVIILFGLLFMFNRILLKNETKINLLGLTLINTLIVLISCLLGTFNFFF